VGHGARAAHALDRCGLEHLADLGLREQGNVARDLADRLGDDRELDHQAQELVALVVPLARLVEMQAHRHAVADRRALAAERVQGADRPAELDAERPLARFGKPEPAPVERRRPARDLHAGRDGRGRLHEGPPEHHRARVAMGVTDQAAHGGRQHAVGVGEAGLQAEDQGGVEHVLARRAVMDERRRAGVGAGDVLRECLDQRNGQRARPLALGGQRLRRQAQIATGPGDDARGVLRNDADVALGEGERALEVEHRPHERLGGQRPGERVTREAPADEIHDDRRPGTRAR
jgi:hypothetical protein